MALEIKDSIQASALVLSKPNRKKISETPLHTHAEVFQLPELRAASLTI